MRGAILAVLIVMATIPGAAVWPAAGPGAAAGMVLSTARNLRIQGCSGHPGIRVVLRDSGALDSAAMQWSRGADLKSAVGQSGYREEQSAALHVSGDTSVLQQALRTRLCAALTDRNFTDLGSVQRGHDTWIVIAAPFTPPAAANADEIAAELLLRINRARAQPRRCGNKAFPAAPPLQASALLRRAAEAHAQDMLGHNYFAHQGYDGSTPAQRVAATGYRYQLVGENIAAGPQSAAEAAEGWLASPAHCENIMDARFTESGIAYAANNSGTPQVYWVQEFATPR
ncbi:MAG TPA: CAP domain-containing protein [Steroidobacteraceae bacterium]|nr:CAP domain-containing protein [Steroidobacteraceae bacterium]